MLTAGGGTPAIYRDAFRYAGVDDPTLSSGNGHRVGMHSSRLRQSAAAVATAMLRLPRQTQLAGAD
jgi:hypothetical protein